MRLARAATTAVLVLVMAACVPICGIGAKFALSNAHVDSEYKCPYPSTDAAYDLHGSIDADNSTATTVKINSMSEDDTLVGTGGNWNGASKGHKDSGPITNFQPKSIGSGQNATIKFTIPFQCTNSGPRVPTYGDFSFTFTLVTSSGKYTIQSSDNHRLSFVTT